MRNLRTFTPIQSDRKRYKFNPYLLQYKLRTNLINTS